MPPRTRVPDKSTLQRWLEEGLTQQQMVDRTYEETGEVVTRSAIANAIVRYGMATDGARYDKEVPWNINPIHATATPLRNLRLLGRRNAGRAMNDRERVILDTWLEELAENEWIVGYDPDDMTGFHYISARYKDHRGSAPVRRRPLRMSAT